MNFLLRILPFAFLVVLMSCSDDDHTVVPAILSPEMHAVYYPDQVVTFKWSVPDSSCRVAMQILLREDESFFDNASAIFDTLHAVQIFQMTSRYELSFSAGFTTSLYGAFRLRYNGPSGWSDWSTIHFFRVDPYSAFDVKPLSLTAAFNFDAEENNTYYSDHVQSQNIINLRNEILAKGYDLAKLVFVRPIDGAGKVEILSDHPDHIERIVFGFPGHDGTYPFHPFGDAYAIQYSPPPAVYPFHDWYADIGDSEQPMEMVYFLSRFRELSDELGVHHSISVTVDLNCYFRKND